MKCPLIALAVSVILAGTCNANSNVLWGVWNIGEKSDARYNAEISLGYFLRTGNFLKIDPNRKGKPEIQFEGGYYAIKNIQEKGETLFITLDYATMVKSETGKWKNGNITGVVAMHFMTTDEAWFEVLYDDKNTDTRFPKTDFPGKSVVYWRAQKIDHPVESDDGN